MPPGLHSRPAGSSPLQAILETRVLWFGPGRPVLKAWLEVPQCQEAGLREVTSGFGPHLGIHLLDGLKC